MTEDYKEQLLNYVTGNLEISSPVDIDFNILENQKYMWSDIIPPNDAFSLNGIMKVPEKYGAYSVAYGGYEYNNQIFGWVGILDDKMKPIVILEEFDSGTKLRSIQKLVMDENANIYGVDDTSDENISGASGTKRFIMLNNFTLPVNDEYKINLRYSYNLGDNTFQCREISKAPNSSKYVLLGSNSRNNYYARAIELTIEVGQPVQVTRYGSTSIESGYYTRKFLGGGVFWDSSDNFEFSIIAYSYTVNSGIKYSNLLLLKNGTGTLNYTKIKDYSTPQDTITFMRTCNYAFRTNTESYIVYTNHQMDSGGISANYVNTIIELYHIQGTTVSTMYSNTYVNENSYLEQLVPLLDTNNNLIVARLTKSDNDVNLYLAKETLNWTNIYTFEDAEFDLRFSNVAFNRKYNILNYSYFLTYLYQPGSSPVRDPSKYFNLYFQQLNLANGYNGQPYVNTNVLSPLYSNLYSNGSLVFSRNLYNISKQNNMTMSSVEIPNNYLNDLTITQNDLISETNFQMNSNLQNWTKNIYEVVDLNFLNTISVIDEDTSETYLQGAIRVNNSITDINDYDDAKCTKYRINYTDNTTKVEGITWTEIDSTHKETSISLYVDKPMISIDFISEDEETIYCTKMLEVEVDKYYTLTQKIKVGE